MCYYSRCAYLGGKRREVRATEECVLMEAADWGCDFAALAIAHDVVPRMDAIGLEKQLTEQILKRTKSKCRWV